MFYGWWVVGACFLIMLYMSGVVFFGFTAFFQPIANEFGWSYTQISLAASLRGFETSLLAPLFGTLVDRWGPRRVIFGGSFITALGLILLSHVTSLAMLYGAFALMAVGLGTSSTVVLMTAPANWFRRNIGIVSGIVMSGFGIGGVLIVVVARLIDLYDWRITMTILALGVLAIVPPLSLLVRHKPEQYGYLPDGEAKGTTKLDSGLARPQAMDVSFNAKQAFKTIPFWRMTTAFIFLSIVQNAIFTHIMPYLSTIGITRSTSSLVATTTSLMSVGGRLGLGQLADKFDRRWVAAGAFAIMALGVLSFGYVSTVGTWLLVPFIVLFGIGYGGSNSLRPSLVREFFGRINFGAVLGWITGISALGGILGPPLAGWVYDNWGSYQGIWFVFAGLAVVGLISILTTPSATTLVKQTDKV